MDRSRSHWWHLQFELQGLGLVALAGLLLVGAGWLVAGGVGAALALVLLAFSAALGGGVPPVVAMRLAGARPLPLVRSGDLGSMVAGLATAAGLPRIPQLYLVPGRSLNAFAAGRAEDSALAVSEGLLRVLDRRRLRAVLAHEIGHIAHDDSALLGLVARIGTSARWLAQVGLVLAVVTLPLALVGVPPPFLPVLLLALVPWATVAAQQALSRVREFAADRFAADLLGDGAALADALETLESVQAGFRCRWRRWLTAPEPPTWLRSHPPTPDRIAALRGSHIAADRLIRRGFKEMTVEPMRSRCQPRWVPSV